MKKSFFLFCSIVLMYAGCGVYTFSGSTLASHLKTVDIPLFVNQSLKPSIAEGITQELNREILATNLMRVVSQAGDASISGTVTSYSNSPYTFGAAETRLVNVEQYVVRIVADVDFYDNKKNESIYKGTITGEGIYNFSGETEETGIQKATNDLVKKVLQNSVQSW